MRQSKFIAMLLACSGLLGVASSQAHHSFSMFERDTEMHLTGTVTRWAFNNPHSWLYMTVKDENGKEVEWGFEGNAPPSLVRNHLSRGIAMLRRRLLPATELAVRELPSASAGAPRRR